MRTAKIPKKEIFLIADRDRSDVALRLSFLSTIISQKKNFEPLVLFNSKQTQEVKKIFKTFKIFNTKKVELTLKDYFLYILISLKFVESLIKIAVKGFDWFVESYKINEIRLGDLIYDKYIRNDLSYIKPSLLDTKFIFLLLKSIYQYYVIENIFVTNTVKFSLIGSLSYISTSNLILRISQKNKIPTAFVSADGYKIYRKNTPPGDPIIDEIERSLKKYKFNFLKKKSEIYFHQRIKGKLKKKRYDPKLFFQHDEQNWAKSASSNNKFLDNLKLLKKSYSKVILFAPHAFSECNHLFGDLIFRDFHQHSIETLQFAREQKQTLWLYKIHPFSQIKYGEYNSSVKSFKKYSQKNILLVPMNIKTKDLFPHIDLVTSSRGTICIEAATFGIKSLITTNIFYDNWKISHRAKNKNDYFQLLKNINLIKKPSNKTITMAKILLYLRKKLQSNFEYNLITPRKLIDKKEFFQILNKVDKTNNSKIYSLYSNIFKELEKKNDKKKI